MAAEAFARLRLERAECVIPGYGVVSVPGKGRWECCVWDDLSQPMVVLAVCDTAAEADDWCRRWNEA